MPTAKAPPDSRGQTGNKANGNRTNGGLAIATEESSVVSRVRMALIEAAADHRAATDPGGAIKHAVTDVASATLEATSAETAAHSDDVDVISEGLCKGLGVGPEETEDILLAARLHDIGKIAVPPHMLEKPGKLSDAEWQVIQMHTVWGEKIIGSVPELAPAAQLVRHSHERWDGGGYPDGLAGGEIPLGSRIILCADAFHAIRSHRPYRRGRTAAEALAEIRACSGTQFDPAVAEVMDRMAHEFRQAAARHSPSGRASRLMALLLVVGVGAVGSAVARSGLVGEPGTAGAASGAPTAAMPGAAPGSNQVPPGWLGAPAAARGAGGFTFCPPDVCSDTTPGGLLGVLLPPRLAFGPSLPGGEGTGGNPFAGPAPGHDDHPGVRDHGHGIGRGKGNGKGKGYINGNGHSKKEGSGGGGGNGNSHPGNSGSGGSGSTGNGSSSSGGNGTGGPKPKPKPTSNAGGNGNGGGNGGGAAVKPPKPAPPPTQVPPTGPGNSNGNGNAYGVGNGNGNANGQSN